MTIRVNGIMHKIYQNNTDSIKNKVTNMNENKKIKTTMTFAEFREFNRDLKRLKRKLKTTTDNEAIANIQAQIDLIAKTLKLS